MASQVSAPAVPAPAAPEPAHDNFLFRLLTENFDEGQVVRELHQKEKENPGTLSTIVTLKHKIYVLANYNSKVDTIKADRDIIDLIRFVFNKQFSEYLDTIKELAERIKTNAVIFNDAALGKKGMWEKWEKNQIILLERRVDKAQMAEEERERVAAARLEKEAAAAAKRAARLEKEAAAAAKRAEDEAAAQTRAEAEAARSKREADEKNALAQKIATEKNKRDKTIEYKNTLRQFYINQLEIGPDPDTNRFEKDLNSMLYIPNLSKDDFTYQKILLTGKHESSSGDKSKPFMITTFIDKDGIKYDRTKISKYHEKVAAGLAEIKRVLDSNELKDQNNKVVAQLVITEFMENSNDTDSTLTENDAFLMRIKEITTRNNQLQQEFETFKKKTDKGEREVIEYDNLLQRTGNIITTEIQKLYNSLRVKTIDKKFTFKNANTLFDKIKGLNTKVEKNYKELLAYDLSSLAAIRKQLEDATQAEAEIAREAAETLAREAREAEETVAREAAEAAKQAEEARKAAEAAKQAEEARKAALIKIQQAVRNRKPRPNPVADSASPEPAAEEEEKEEEKDAEGDDAAAARVAAQGDPVPKLELSDKNPASDASPQVSASIDTFNKLISDIKEANKDSVIFDAEVKKTAMTKLTKLMHDTAAGRIWSTVFDETEVKGKEFLALRKQLKPYETLLEYANTELKKLQGNVSNYQDLSNELTQFLDAYAPYKKMIDTLQDRFDHPQNDRKGVLSSDDTPTPRGNRPPVDAPVAAGGTRRGGKRFHKKTFKKKRFNRKTFKKKRFNRNTGNKKTFKKKTSNTKSGNNKTGNNKRFNNKTGNNKRFNNKTGNNKRFNNKTGNNKRFNNKTGNNKIVNKKTIRKNYFKRKQTHKK